MDYKKVETVLLFRSIPHLKKCIHLASPDIITFF